MTRGVTSWMFVALAGASLGLLGGCRAGAGDAELAQSGEDALTTVSDGDVALARSHDLGALTFEHLTPTGERIMRASRWWMTVQDERPRFPLPRMCAVNVSQVLFLAGVTRYDQEGVRNLVADVAKSDGSRVIAMPREKAAFIDTLVGLHGGRIPAGTVIAGMNVHTSAPGDQHVGFIGHTDPSGQIWIYHNNWYRPDNEGGIRKPHMVSEENLARGFPRQWMATPWLRIARNPAGEIVDVTSLLPALDDMDPFNPSFQVTLAVPAEIEGELR